MSDVECPYCGKDQEIDHDDGKGYDESVEHEQYCSDCGKEFIFETTVMYHYSVSCQPSDHKLSHFKDNVFFCDNCDYHQVGDLVESDL